MINKLATIFFLIFSDLIFADDLAYTIEKKKDKLILATNQCERGEAIVNSLAEWSKNLDLESSCKISKKNQSKNCQFDISSCVPLHVKKYHNEKMINSGPNCWNLTLALTEIIPGLRYSTAEEMNFFMRSPLCKSVKNFEKRRPGDIVAIREYDTSLNKWEEFHGYIYISEDIAYSKNGNSKKSPYLLQPLTNVYKNYSIPSEKSCHMNQIDKNTSKVCNRAESVFRCTSFREYLLNNKKSNIDYSVNQNIDKFEKCFEKLIVFNPIYNENTEASLIAYSKILENYLNTEIQKLKKIKKRNPKDEFILASLKVRLTSLKQSLEGRKGFELQDEINEVFEKFAKKVSQDAIKQK